MGTEKQLPHVFEVGDLVADQKMNLKVILEVGLDRYKFILLQQESVKDVVRDKDIIWQKGCISEQPFYVFDKYQYHYQPQK